MDKYYIRYDYKDGDEQRYNCIQEIPTTWEWAGVKAMYKMFKRDPCKYQVEILVRVEEGFIHD